jgi:hypothetical protein
MKNAAKQRGSAFVLALMVLAILTVVGLSISMISETEMAIGETEKVQNELFYATEAGVTTQLAGLVVTNDTGPISIVIPGGTLERSRADLSIGFDVLSSGMAPVAEGTMDYTKANAGRNDQFKSFFYHTRTLARRTAWPEGQAVPTCDEVEDNALGSNLTSISFYYSPTQGLSDYALYVSAGVDKTTTWSAVDYCGKDSSGKSVFEYVTSE